MMRVIINYGYYIAGLLDAEMNKAENRPLGTLGSIRVRRERSNQSSYRISELWR